MTKSLVQKHPRLYEVFKFLLVGGISTLIDFAVMYLFFEFIFANTILATGIGFLTGLAFNWYFSVVYVYTADDNDAKFAKSAKGFIFFGVLSGIGLAIHMLGMWLGNVKMGINEWLIKVVLTIVVLTFNYITRKKLIFSKNRHIPQGQSKR